MGSEKVILISGGSRGLGSAFTEAMLEAGYEVATFSRKKTDFIVCMQEKYSDRFYWKETDVLDTAGMKEFVKSVYKKFGKIDVLLNNAGRSQEGLLPLMSEESILNTVSINVNATILLTQYVVKFMLKNGGGNIINISSIVGTRGFKGDAVYSATKAATDGFTRSLARELGSKGIRVNSIAPGFMATDMTANMSEAKKNQIIRRTPLGRLGAVEDMTGLAKFLISDEAGFITGQTFVVDGGLTC